MDEMKKDPQELTPEDQLDLLLEKFLSDPNDEVPTLEDTLPTEDSTPEITEEPLEISQDQPAPASPEEQLDNLLASFQDLSDEPLPQETSPAEEALEMPELVSFWDIVPGKDASADTQTTEEESPAAENDEVIPVILPVEDKAEDTDTSAKEEATEDEPIEDEEEDAPEEENDEVIPVILPTEDKAEDTDTPAKEEATEDEPIEDEEEDAPEEENDEVIPVILPAEDKAEDEPIENEEEDATEEENDEVIPMILPVEDKAEDTDAPSEEEPTEDEPAENTEEQEKTDEETQDPEKDQSADESGDEADGSQKDNAEESTAIAEPVKENEAPKEETASDTEEDRKEEEDTEPPAPPKKRRPRNTKAYGFFGIPHLLATVIWLGIIVFIGVGLGTTVWNCVEDVLALGRPDSQVVITITDEDDLESIADKLKATGLIKYPSLFVIYGDISDAMDTIRTGTFKLNTLFDYHALVDAMSSNQRRETTSVTVPEGFTCAQMFRLLESKGVTTVAKLEAAAVNGDLGDYWFLEGVDRNAPNCLEGFLFPDTYTFYLDHDPEGVLIKFLDNFNKRFNESMKIKLDTLNQTLSEKMRANGLSEEYIAAHQMTVRDVVIIASMIEKETASNPESYNISSVIYNRLTNPDVYPFLNIDAALVYVLGHGDLTFEDLKYDSPYNTYLYPGLIPGAISNPGSYSLDAALDPTETEYYYYALDPSTGSHHFSKTLKEHNDFLESIRKEEPEEETEE